jgi:serine/threonine-protein kinase
VDVAASLPRASQSPAPALPFAGRYHVGREVARGGTCVIYAAEHAFTGRPVALKLPVPEYAHESELHERILREARALEIARHPGVVEVLDAGQDEAGGAFLAMEMLDGRAVDGLLAARRALGVLDTVRIGAKLCEALAAVHERGIVHRDLKPSNVFVVRGEDGREAVKLIDFGIAALRGEGAAHPAAARKLTRRDVVLGTPEYMSPEQLMMEERVDHRSDLYSLAVSLYECLVGDVPWSGSYAEILLAVSTRPAPDVRDLRADVPDALAQVLGQAMSRDPAKRPPTAGAFGRALIRAVPAAMAQGAAPLLPAVRGVVLPEALADEEVATLEVQTVRPPPPPDVAQRRRFARAAYVAPVAIAHADGYKVHGRTEDVSEGGLLVVSAKPCRGGERVRVAFAPPGQRSPAVVDAVVRWSRAGRGQFACGLELVAPPAAVREAIAAYVADRGGA